MEEDAAGGRLHARRFRLHGDDFNMSKSKLPRREAVVESEDNYWQTQCISSNFVSF